MPTRWICQKCSHPLETWSERALHCSNCNLLWQWDPPSDSLICLGYPPPGARPTDNSQLPNRPAP